MNWRWMGDNFRFNIQKYQMISMGNKFFCSRLQTLWFKSNINDGMRSYKSYKCKFINKCHSNVWLNHAQWKEDKCAKWMNENEINYH